MDQVRKAIKYIGEQLGRLTVTQRLLIASLAIVMAMTLFLVSQYAGSPQLVEVVPAGTPDDQDRVAQNLDKAGIPYQKSTAGKVMVTSDRRYPALAQLAREHALPSDKRLMFNTLVTQGNWMMSNQQLTQMNTIALTNELAAVMRNFPGIEDATVFISNPEPAGIGAAARKPVAHATVFPKQGTSLDQSTVNSLADMVSGAVAGLDPRDVAIIDGTNKRSHRATSGEDSFSGTYIEQVAKVERRWQEKISDQLRYIGDVIVSVNAIVDGAQRRTNESRFSEKGRGTILLPIEETTQTNTSTNASKSGLEPGLNSNTGMDISRGSGSGGGSNSNDESTTTKYQPSVGRKEITQIDARGRPTKINVTVSVPRDYVAQVAKMRKGTAASAGGAGAAGLERGSGEPTEDEIKQAWEATDGVKGQIEAQIAPLTETNGQEGDKLTIGTVKAFLIPVSMASANMGSAGSAAGSGGFFGLLGSSNGGWQGLAGSNVMKTTALGALALLAVGLMFFMVRKASRASPLPTAEELVGIPPALQAGSDLVGEAEETDTAMVGIEVDPERLKTSKMLEEVTLLVKSNPSAAAGVFNRWLSTDT